MVTCPRHWEVKDPTSAALHESYDHLSHGKSCHFLQTCPFSEHLSCLPITSTRVQHGTPGWLFEPDLSGRSPRSGWPLLRKQTPLILPPVATLPIEGFAIGHFALRRKSRTQHSVWVRAAKWPKTCVFCRGSLHWDWMLPWCLSCLSRVFDLKKYVLATSNTPRKTQKILLLRESMQSAGVQLRVSKFHAGTHAYNMPRAPDVWHRTGGPAVPKQPDKGWQRVGFTTGPFRQWNASRLLAQNCTIYMLDLHVGKPRSLCCTHGPHCYGAIGVAWQVNIHVAVSRSMGETENKKSKLLSCPWTEQDLKCLGSLGNDKVQQPVGNCNCFHPYTTPLGVDGAKVLREEGMKEGHKSPGDRLETPFKKSWSVEQMHAPLLWSDRSPKLRDHQFQLAPVLLEYARWLRNGCGCCGLYYIRSGPNLFTDRKRWEEAVWLPAMVWHSKDWTMVQMRNTCEEHMSHFCFLNFC